MTSAQIQNLFPPDSLLWFPTFVNIAEEIQKRRTFAIISHPDAGKTTLTEKLLLYGGAVQLAGSVTARKNQRATTSDWMELEKKRGISISSTVLQFDYNGYRLNLLDTPGHKDFSEDTYRVLTAVDSVVMVIDAAKGIEPQTRKLFEVCRQRGVPIFTFMNKCDRPMKDPLALLDELERVLGIGAFPVNWPLGNGFEFQGVYDRQTKLMHLFERTVGGQYPRAGVRSADCDDPAVRGQLDDATFHRTVEELEMLERAGHDWDDAAVLAGKTTPVFFGSASNNFGVQLLLDGFLKHAPAAQTARDGRHRDRAGEPGVLRFHLQDPGEHGPEAPRPHRVRPRLLRQIRARHDRASLALREEGAPLQLAQAVRQRTRDGGRGVSRRRHRPRRPRQLRHRRHAHDRSRASLYKEIPRFTPEAFSYLHNPNTAKFKQFRQGLDQLLQEGVIQALYLRNSSVKTPLLAAVGPLQFEVVQFRLESEYGAESRLEAAPWTVVRWLPADMKEDDLDALSLPTGARLAYDMGKNPVVLFPNEWSANYFSKTNERVPLSALPVQTAKE